MKITTILIEKAIGHSLAHDLTQIDAEEKTKGARFRRGYILTADDLPVLKRMGRVNLSVLSLEDDEVHEDDAALTLAGSLSGESVEVRGPEEGRCQLVAARRGVARFEPECVRLINTDREWAFGTIPPNAIVQPGSPIASFRILPLVLKRTSLLKAVDLAPI